MNLFDGILLLLQKEMKTESIQSVTTDNESELSNQFKMDDLDDIVILDISFFNLEISLEEYSRLSDSIMIFNRSFAMQEASSL